MFAKNEWGHHVQFSFEKEIPCHQKENSKNNNKLNWPVRLPANTEGDGEIQQQQMKKQVQNCCRDERFCLQLD